MAGVREEVAGGSTSGWLHTAGESHHQQNWPQPLSRIFVAVDERGLCSVSVRGGARWREENAGRGRPPPADSALQTVWQAAVCAGGQGWPVLEPIMPGREEEAGLWRILPGFLRKGLLG